MLTGVIILAVGIRFLVQPAVIVSLIPIVLGVVLLFHGLRAIKETIEAKKFGYDAWGADLILAIISLICGFICVFDAFGVMEKATIVVGIILIYNGVSNIWISCSATRAAKDYARRNATVDVNFVEDDDDKRDRWNLRWNDLDLPRSEMNYLLQRESFRLLIIIQLSMRLPCLGTMR